MLLNEMFHVKYPVIQGAMANIATAEFAAAVSNAGGIGVIGTGAMNVDQAREAIRRCRSLTDKPFGVNVMMMNPYTKELMEMIAEEHVALITTGAGNPGVYMSMLKESGAKVFPVVPSVAMAIRMERSGADGLIVEGGEAGGHVGEQTTMALLPQVADAVNIPIVAAGRYRRQPAVCAQLSVWVRSVCRSEHVCLYQKSVRSMKTTSRLSSKRRIQTRS